MSLPNWAHLGQIPSPGPPSPQSSTHPWALCCQSDPRLPRCQERPEGQDAHEVPVCLGNQEAQGVLGDPSCRLHPGLPSWHSQPPLPVALEGGREMRGLTWMLLRKAGRQSIPTAPGRWDGCADRKGGG